MSEILAWTSSGGTMDWYLTDKLGSVRNIVDPSGNVLDTVAYDSFGTIVTETDAAEGDRFKFAGMQYDGATGQYLDNARWYDPGSGRFLGNETRTHLVSGMTLGYKLFASQCPPHAIRRP